ncbi:MAG TPA: hypothetical protein VGG03_10460 [Thermoanaerobaculia bacterium]|jgi:hypothetical protein
MDDLLDRDFRANPSYDLVLFDRLPDEERRALAGLADDPGFYGVLRRRGAPGPGPRSVDRDTALLFLTLREPGRLPSYVRAALGESASRAIGRLVADGVLEVESGGSFVSGPAALDQFGGSRREAGSGRIAVLSLAALRAAQALPVEDPERLAWTLYTYNRRPLTPRWQRALPDAAAVERFLGIAPEGPHRRRLRGSWEPAPSEYWLSWRFRRRTGTPAPSAVSYKLYVSPLPEVLGEGFGAILDALTAARAYQFKVGSNALGLLRPDKIVAYFSGFEPLAEAAAVVCRRLAGAPAQGVPFTSEIGGDGLLSWGVDPPRETPAADEGESWRLWLARRLAQALLAARSATAEAAEPWRFALDRLRLEGIDTATWTPGTLLWREG